MLIVLWMLFVALTLTSCNDCKPEVEYVYKYQRVNIPVKCSVPDANCSFDRNTSTEVVSALLECIITMKHNEKVCK